MNSLRPTGENRYSVRRPEENRPVFKHRMLVHTDEFKLRFDPKFIVYYTNKIRREQRSECFGDICKMVMIGVERGNNLEKILRSTAEPEFVTELERLIRTYYLVSDPRSSKYSTTLFRLCDSYPILTCTYIKYARHLAVPVDRMQSISKNYPTVMMTSAFAFLIPNRKELFCSLLKKAHMLHQYVYFATINGSKNNRSAARRARSSDYQLYSGVMKHTYAAINDSHIDYETQLMFLLKNRLISVNIYDSTIIVSNDVLEAVKIWEKYVEG